MSKTKEVKPITFTYDGIDYKLEYTRASLKTMKLEGFDARVISEDDSDPTDKLEAIAMLWRGAFLKNHRQIKQTLCDEIYEKMPNKTQLIERLMELFAEPFKALTNEPSGEAISWE